MTDVATFHSRPWPQIRNTVESVLIQHRRHTIYGLFEADVTAALRAIREQQRQLRCAVSFHAFVLYCLSRAAAANPEVLTYRYGNSLITFDDVDVGTVVDKRLPDGVRLPVGYTLRKAQAKRLAQINWELRRAVRDKLDSEALRLRRRVAKWPTLFRRFMSWRIKRNPFLLQRIHGTIGFTSAQTPGLKSAYFGLVPNIFTVTVAIGSIVRRPALTNSSETHNILCLTGGADHLVIDGMALARCVADLTALLESTAALEEDFAEETRSLLAEEKP